MTFCFETTQMMTLHPILCASRTWEENQVGLAIPKTSHFFFSTRTVLTHLLGNISNRVLIWISWLTLSHRDRQSPYSLLCWIFILVSHSLTAHRKRNIIHLDWSICPFILQDDLSSSWLYGVGLIIEIDTLQFFPSHLDFWSQNNRKCQYAMQSQQRWNTAFSAISCMNFLNWDIKRMSQCC